MCIYANTSSNINSELQYRQIRHMMKQLSNQIKSNININKQDVKFQLKLTYYFIDVVIPIIFFQYNEMIEKHSWKPVCCTSSSSAKPSSRWGHSSCVIDDQLVLFGGYADSIYMNDLWVYHTLNMQWTELKTFGAVPSQRSNSSFHYDKSNNRIIMFGGGGANKTRFNSVHMLDWNTKIWSQVVIKENQACPWERTYHSSELLYPYLIVYGGEGVADLDDLWLFNIETKLWTEAAIPKNAIRPCGRRFHSSCLIGNQFYVIAGCYSKYRPLSDVFSIDLTKLIKTGSTEGLKWQEAQFKGSSFLMRWGHACASLENRIYIFGGRFSNDLNDILVLDMQTMKMKSLKTPPDTMPKPRRRACINFIGNCMLMFGGFNSQYFNDLHYINVTDSIPKPKKYIKDNTSIVSLVNEKLGSDCSIECWNGELVYCHKGLLLHNFQNQEKLDQFLGKISRMHQKNTLVQVLQALYQGFGKNSVLDAYIKNFPASQEEKESQFLREIQKIQHESGKNSLNISLSNNIFSNPKHHLVRILNNNIIELADDQFGQYLQKNRDNTYKDIDIIVNEEYQLYSNALILMSQSRYFNNLLKSGFQQSQQQSRGKDGHRWQVKMWIPNGNVVLMEIVLNFLLNSMLVVPENMSHQSWQQLYELADYFSLRDLTQIVSYTLYTKIQQSTADQILRFSTVNNLDKLALACARIKIKLIQKDTNCESEILDIYMNMKNSSNKYVQAAYLQNRFEIKQKLMMKENSTSLLKKKSSCMSTQGEKENYQICNE